MATLPMVYSNPDELPIIGRFEERVDLTTARQPLYMYLSREEVMEEPIDLTAPVKKDSEYYKRRRQRRRQFKAQSLLLLEDSTPRGIRGILPHSDFLLFKDTSIDALTTFAMQTTWTYAVRRIEVC